MNSLVPFKNRSVGFILPVACCIFSFNCKPTPGHPSAKHDPGIFYSSSTKMKFKLIEPGTFTMGSPDNEFQSDTNEHPKHIVRLTQPYYIGVFEVTQDEFTRTMGFNPSTAKGSIRLPVETLSWFDAALFCNTLSKKDGLDTVYTISGIKMEGQHIADAEIKWNREKNGYRLPTEAEWEFACRAGTTTPFPYGNSINTEQANYDGTVSFLENSGAEHLRNETKGIYRKTPLPVDSLIPNNFGLYHIVGNVFEWVWDYYGKYPPGERSDPTGPGSGSQRVRRSGAYGSPGYHMRSALRHGVPPGLALFHMGLRVARSYRSKQ